MSYQTHEEDDSSRKRDAELDKVLGEILSTLDGVINAINYQILGNSDELHEKISDQAEKVTLKTYVENFIKNPFRRQVGRLKKVRRLLLEFKTRTETKNNG